MNVILLCSNHRHLSAINVAIFRVVSATTPKMSVITV